MSPVSTFSYRRLPLLLLALVLMLSFSACTDECETNTTSVVQEPILISRAQMVQAVASQPARALKNPGKIYTKEDLVFINETGKGIHVIDNANPAAPRPVSFINIPGNVDLAIRDQILYADAGPDLLALDISDLNHVTVRKHIYNSFIESMAGSTFGNSIVPTLNDRITIGYETKVVTNTTPCDGEGAIWEDRGVMYFSNSPSAMATKSAGASTGTGGSMARFTIYGNHLYTISPNALRVYGITNPASPEKGKLVNLWGGVETVFPYENKLFFGSMSGLLIYDISNAETPAYLGSYTHAIACDPVVVDGNYAYVTLRDTPGNQGMGIMGRCGARNSNQLDVVDISDPRRPRLQKTFAMQSPFGLGIDRNTLFLCEGEFGLKVFDATDPLAVGNRQTAHYKNMNMFDVIPLGNTLLAIGSDGLYQYDYTDTKNIRFLSKIPVVR